MGSYTILKVSSTILNLLAVLLGLILGLGLRYGIGGEWGHYNVSKQYNIEFGVSFIGECYNCLLKSLLIPLIIPVVIITFKSLNSDECKAIGFWFSIYSIIGITVSHLFI